MPKEVVNDWKRWISRLNGLKEFPINRKFEVVESSIHHFSDASDSGYGQASYLWLINKSGNNTCCLVMGKACVAPLK